MPRCASHKYPISKLIAQVMTDSRFGRPQFVSSIGYCNVQAGLRHLDEWLEHGQGDSRILHRITRSYNVDLTAALAATNQMKRAEFEALGAAS
jgi:hypothetical protein